MPGGSRTAFERRDACTACLGPERRGSGQECTLSLPARPPSPGCGPLTSRPPGEALCPAAPCSLPAALGGVKEPPAPGGPPRTTQLPLLKPFPLSRSPGPGALLMWVRRCSCGVVCAGAGGAGQQCPNRWRLKTVAWPTRVSPPGCGSPRGRGPAVAPLRARGVEFHFPDSWGLRHLVSSGPAC